jgi:hypothetical protein
MPAGVKPSVTLDELVSEMTQKKSVAAGVAADARRSKTACVRSPVVVRHGAEALNFALTRCDGSPAPHAIESLSLLARPDADGDADAPSSPKLDPRVLERLQVLVDHFGKDGHAPAITIVSGARASGSGPHARGRAVDVRVDGASGTDLLAYCKTLADTGCGWYANERFLHLDVRERGSGKVSWVDARNAPPKHEGKPAPAAEPKPALHHEEPATAAHPEEPTSDEVTDR